MKKLMKDFNFAKMYRIDKEKIAEMLKLYAKEELTIHDGVDVANELKGLENGG